MNIKDIKEITESQRTYFRSGATLPVKFRIEMLRRLYASVKTYEGEIFSALSLDLGKCEYESFMCEVGLLLSEISYMIKNVKKFAKEKRVHTPISQFPAKSYTKPTPYGCVLIMSPWNYPFLLAFCPLVNAIAAGNCAVVKPSAYSPATSAITEKIISECFPPEYVAVITGGRQENAALLDERFDLIFFTGSQSVGKEVLRKAAEHLTPAVLELGGKSPCIVEESAKLELAAKRIVFGKFLNCGQTCVAPDYILCHSSVKDKLILELRRQIELQYGKAPLENPLYGKIVNEKHFMRLRDLIMPEKTVVGGEGCEERLKIAPTVMANVSFEDAVMKEEIFGPLLPVLTYDSYDELYTLLLDKPKPLALYIFSENKKHVRELTERLQYGGGCINDCVIHLATSEMGFGGVGESGMGAYHGKRGFDAFSHLKSIVDKSTKIDPEPRYQPYRGGLSWKLMRMFLK